MLNLALEKGAVNHCAQILPLALRPREAAKSLGISPRHLWQLTKDGRIPCVRIGDGKRKTVLYSVADLQAWLTRESVSGLEAK